MIWREYNEAAPIQPHIRDKWALDAIAGRMPDGMVRICHSGDSIVIAWPDGDGMGVLYDCQIRRITEPVPIAGWDVAPTTDTFTAAP